MKNIKAEKSLKNLYYLSLIPILGYVIVLFYGEFKAYSVRKNIFHAWIFAILSMLSLAVLTMIIVIIFITGLANFIPMPIVAILSIILINCAAFCSVIILEKFLKKLSE